MKQAQLYIGILVLIVFVGGVVYISSRPGEEVKIDTETSIPTNTETTYTFTDVQTHASKASCWAVVSGNVYDLTTWIDNHPGGEAAILSLCGKDGTAAFTAQHGTTGNPNDVLAAYKIGVLVQ